MSPQEFSDFWGPKFNFGAGIGYPVGVDQKLTLVGYFDYNSFGIDEAQVIAASGAGGLGLTVSGGSIKVLTITANLKASPAPASRVVPYVIAGGGFLRLSAGDFTVSGGGQTISQSFDESESKMGVGFGGGLDIPVTGRATVFIEVRYTIGFTEGDKIQYLPLKAGLSFR